MPRTTDLVRPARRLTFNGLAVGADHRRIHRRSSSRGRAVAGAFIASRTLAESDTTKDVIRRFAPLMLLPPTVRQGEAMTEPERLSPTCGALLVDERRANDAASGTAIPVWQCERQHCWLHSMVHGWVPIDPGAIVEEEATTTVEDK
jgi:hypothetical protein